jgi:type VI secretion system secreted protein Hcp
MERLSRTMVVAIMVVIITFRREKQMVQSLKGVMPRVTLLLVAALLTLGLLSACDILDTKAPDEESTEDEPSEVAGDESPESDSLPGDTDFITENGGAVLGSPGSYNIFIQITGIEGESTDDAHEDWIEVLSYSHSVSQPASGLATGSRTSGRVEHQDFTITKELDKASPKLALYCCNGTHIEEVTIELCYADGDKAKFMEYALTDVIVTSVIPSGYAGIEDRPTEQVSLNYGRIQWTYTEYDDTGKPKGNVEAQWNVETGMGG